MQSTQVWSEFRGSLQQRQDYFVMENQKITPGTVFKKLPRINLGSSELSLKTSSLESYKKNSRVLLEQVCARKGQKLRRRSCPLRQIRRSPFRLSEKKAHRHKSALEYKPLPYSDLFGFAVFYMCRTPPLVVCFVLHLTQMPKDVPICDFWKREGTLTWATSDDPYHSDSDCEDQDLRSYKVDTQLFWATLAF